MGIMVWVSVLSLASTQQPPAPVAVPDDLPVKVPRPVGIDGGRGAHEGSGRVVDPRSFVGDAPGDGGRAVGGAPVTFSVPVVDVTASTRGGAAAPLALQPIGNELRVVDARAGRGVGMVSWEGVRLSWSWAGDGAGIGGRDVDEVVDFLGTVRLDVSLDDGRSVELSFARDARAVERQPPAVRAPGASDVLPKLRRDPFMPEVKDNDIAGSSDEVLVEHQRITAIALTEPTWASFPEDLLLWPDPLTRWLLGADRLRLIVLLPSGDAQDPGNKLAVGWFEAVSDRLNWHWPRLSVAKHGPEIESIQALADDLVIEVTLEDGRKSRYRVKDDLDVDGDGLWKEFLRPVGVAGQPGANSRVAQLRAAIAAVEAEFSAEATQYSNDRFRERQEASRRGAAARERERKGRNARQRHEEKFGWYDRHGRWHAPDGHNSRSTDDRRDGVTKSRPNLPRSGFGRAEGWAAKMRAEVEDERRSDPRRYDTDLPLKPPLDEAELRETMEKFVKGKRRAIPDARILRMLDDIAARMPPRPGGPVP